MDMINIGRVTELLMQREKLNELRKGLFSNKDIVLISTIKLEKPFRALSYYGIDFQDDLIRLFFLTIEQRVEKIDEELRTL